MHGSSKPRMGVRFSHGVPKTMSKITIWLNSGANIHSCRKQTGTFEEVLGISKDEWDTYTDEEKDATVLEIVMQYGEWGWREE